MDGYSQKECNPPQRNTAHKQPVSITYRVTRNSYIEILETALDVTATSCIAQLIPFQKLSCNVV